MALLSTLQVAFRALRTHKGRSLLTSLGIVIGIGAVIALVAAGDGARCKLDERLDSIGKTMILLRAGVRTDQGAIADYTPLTAADAQAIRRELGSLLNGVAEVQMTHKLATTRHGSWPVMVVGSSPEVRGIRHWDVAKGRFYTDDDVKKIAPVCLLGQTVRQRLFPDGADPIGQSVRIDKTVFRVIGVAAAKGRSATGADQDDQVFVPLSTLQRRLAGEEKVNLILASARDEESLTAARDGIDRLMRNRHRLKANEPADFDVSSVQELAGLALVVTGTMTGLSAIIASISLLVGGVGIMNVMLASVAERTREVGLRMATGATARAILGQFLLEAATLAFVGGIIGVALGMLAATGLAKALNWPIVVRPTVIMVACGVSAGVGVFFGFYPAWKASRLDPIEALRTE